MPVEVSFGGNGYDAMSEPLNWFHESALFRLAKAEKLEVLRHKWLESERAGRDIGFDAAYVSWCFRHRKQWLRSRQRHE